MTLHFTKLSQEKHNLGNSLPLLVSHKCMQIKGLCEERYCDSLSHEAQLVEVDVGDDVEEKTSSSSSVEHSSGVGDERSSSWHFIDELKQSRKVYQVDNEAILGYEQGSNKSRLRAYRLVKMFKGNNLLPVHKK